MARLAIEECINKPLNMHKYTTSCLISPVNTYSVVNTLYFIGEIPIS